MRTFLTRQFGPEHYGNALGLLGFLHSVSSVVAPAIRVRFLVFGFCLLFLLACTRWLTHTCPNQCNAWSASGQCKVFCDLVSHTVTTMPRSWCISGIRLFARWASGTWKSSPAQKAQCFTASVEWEQSASCVPCSCSFRRMIRLANQVLERVQLKPAPATPQSCRKHSWM